MRTATMTEQDTTYNGWANRTTWLVNLHLTNDQGAYEDARGVVRSAYDNAEVPAHVEGIVTDEQWKLSRTADVLREHVEYFVTDLTGGAMPENLLVADLVGHALAEVDWHEIAEGLLEE